MLASPRAIKRVKSSITPSGRRIAPRLRIRALLTLRVTRARHRLSGNANGHRGFRQVGNVGGGGNAGVIIKRHHVGMKYQHSGMLSNNKQTRRKAANRHGTSA